MYGAILGDIVGSIYENVKTKSFKFVGDEFRYTDDSVMTIAIADGLMKALSEKQIDNEKKTKEYLIDSMHKWGHKYPDAGYGGMFRLWLNNCNREPYNSWGNGSAMRVSSVGWLFDDIYTTRRVAGWTAEVTHNHIEGVKGAEAIASAIFLARCGWYKSEIKEYIEKEFGYDLDRTCDEIRPTYIFDGSCRASLPAAFISFLDGINVVDVIRNAVSLGGDSDTIAAMAGSIAEAYYREFPRSFIPTIHKKLSGEMLQVLEDFDGIRKERINPEGPLPEYPYRSIKTLTEAERKIADHYYQETGNRRKTALDLKVSPKEVNAILDKAKG